MFKAVLLSLAVLLSGCAGLNRYDLEPGMAREAVIARLGRPTGVVALPAGERLQYSLQPMGQYAWMVDLDTAAKVVRSRQVFTAAEFQRIEADKWTRSDVEREFGPPAKVDRITSWNGPILTYRWNDGSDMLYHVYLDPQGVVRRAHPAMEFANVRDRR
jgi:hypothetical protein